MLNRYVFFYVWAYCIITWQLLLLYHLNVLPVSYSNLTSCRLGHRRKLVENIGGGALQNMPGALGTQFPSGVKLQSPAGCLGAQCTIWASSCQHQQTGNGHAAALTPLGARNSASTSSPITTMAELLHGPPT